MKKIWNSIGHLSFWVSLPLLYFYLRAHTRTRVLIVSDDKVLVTKGWLGSGKWVLPGGGLHTREDPIAGAIREVKEETGILLQSNQLRSIGSANFSHYGLRFQYERFIVELPQQVALTKQRWEISELDWMPFQELNPKNSEPDVLELVQAYKTV